MLIMLPTLLLGLLAIFACFCFAATSVGCFSSKTSYTWQIVKTALLTFKIIPIILLYRFMLLKITSRMQFKNNNDIIHSQTYS